MRQITKEEYIEQSYQAFLKNAELSELAKQRAAEEQALVAEYKVDEVNQKRAAIQAKYAALAQPIQAEIVELKNPTKA